MTNQPGAGVVDLNVDLGELPDEPDELYALATVVNIACGGHAGDEASVQRAIQLAMGSGARIAAHPSYADREGFGRRARFSDLPTTVAHLAEQLDLIARVARASGAAVGSVKPHGALYHDASRDPELARAIVDTCVAALPNLESVVGPPESALAETARDRGLAFEPEGFADRRYLADGTLAPRSSPDALLTAGERCAEQAVELARKGRFSTLCIHADTPNALVNARAVRHALEREGLLREQR